MTSGSRPSSPPPDPSGADVRGLLLARDLAPGEAARLLRRYGFADPESANRTLGRMAGAPEERLALAEVLPDILEALAAAGSADRGLRNLERFYAASASKFSLIRGFAGDRPALDRAVVLCSQSQYFADILVREPRLLEWLRTEAEPPDRASLLAEVRGTLAALGDEAHRIAALHRFKRRQLLGCGYRDHVLGEPIEAVAAEISTVAEVVIEAALEIAADRLRARFATLPAGPLPFAVVALGKLGGGELNYSSDIDLLFVHDARAPSGEDIDREVFERLARELVQVLSAFSEEGALYRVDLRLRPEGAQGALSRSVAGAVRYYESYGRTWERQALLKARPVAGERDLGARFVAAIEPFVFRRYLEVAAIGEIKALKRKIEARGAAQPTRDLKQGPGGIRDIEFVVQFLQLLYGSEIAGVRHPSTLGGLGRLERAGCLASRHARTLREAYAFFRTVEHRLQTLHSLQTHVLPADPEDVLDLAHRAGYRGDDARERFMADLERHAAGTRDVLDRVLHALFPEASSDAAAAAASELVLDPAPPPEKVAAVLSAHRIRDPERAMADIRRLATERSRFLAPSPRTRVLLASLLPDLLRALAEGPDPDETLNRFERSTATLGGKAVFYQLLAEHPGTLDLFVRVAAESRFLTGLLTRNPGVFDELVDLLLTAEPVTVERVLARMGVPEGAATAERIRAVFISAMLLVGFRDLGERWNVANVLEGLSALAEATVRAVAPGEAGVAVLALGKLGGREIGYGSDLDLVLSYDGETEAALRSAQGFVRRMEELGLYSVDLRLRPEGRAGPLATSFRALEDYYVSGRAAAWERLAATKLRAVGGDLESTKRAVARLLDVVYAPGAGPEFSGEVAATRAKLEPEKGPLDLKRSPGGLVDIEFATALLKLRARGEPASIRDPGVIPSLHALARAGHLSGPAYVDFLTAYQLLRKVEARLRVVEGRPVSIVPEAPGARRALARRLGYIDTRRRTAEAAFLDELHYHLEATRARFLAVLGETGAPPVRG